ncbi:MAG: MFS transporter [Bacteroidetes bacterium]|jgi:sugar phosphate permease|nr:MFS transporter [Bacteroidota bacterium]
MILTKQHKIFRFRIFAVTWLAYFGFYFCRKNISVLNTSLQTEFGTTNADFAKIVGFYSIMYMLGQFLNGYLSDQKGPRLIVGIGLFLSVIANFFMGLAGSVGVLIFLAGLNGFGQSSGWPGLVKTMSSWYRPNERGIVMSWWTTCYVTGGFLATLFATWWLTNQSILPSLDWKRAFWAPAIVLAIIASVFVIFTRNTPASAGLVPLVKHKNSEIAKDDTVPLKDILTNSAIWIAAIMYFFIKFTRYTFLFWLPTYLEQGLGYSQKAAGYSSSAYELVGFAGVIFAGYASDKMFQSRRFPIGALMLFGLTVVFALQPFLSSQGLVFTTISIGLIGFMTYGPDALMSGAAAMDLGTEKGAAKAAGFINGVGSMGQLISPYVVAFISESYGWDFLFRGFLAVSFISAVLLSTKWNYKKEEAIEAQPSYSL